jgi:hypothetical protein
MSWSFRCIGKPPNVAKAIQDESAKQTGPSKIEFDDAMPHLIALVLQNFQDDISLLPMIDFEASGSGMSQGTGDTLKQVYRSCTVSIKPFHSKLV